MSETQTDLESMLADTAPASKAETQAEQPAPQSEPQQQATGDETPSEGPPPSKAEPEDNSPTVPRKAMEDFRRKWQESEREKQEYAKRLSEFQERMARQPVEQAPPPDPIMDPEGWAAHRDAQYQDQLYRTRVDISTFMMKKEAPDYDEVTEVFVQHAKQNPALWQQIRAHPMPAQFAYEEGKKLKLVSEISTDPAAFEQKIIEKYLASQGQAQPGQQQRAPVTNTPLPKSLASAPSAVARDPKGRYAQQSGPPTLSQLLGEG